AAVSCGAPGPGVCWVGPRPIASIAAALTWSGVSKSGSPTVRSRISWPCALSSRTRWAAAVLGDGLMRSTRCASAMSAGPPLEVEPTGHLEGRHDLQVPDVDVARGGDGEVDRVGDVLRLERFVPVVVLALCLFHVAEQPAEDLRLHPAGADLRDADPVTVPVDAKLPGEGVHGRLRG